MPHNNVPENVKQLAERVAGRLSVVNGKVYKIDPATIFLIIEIIIKIVGWFKEWNKADKTKLSFLQRASVWVTLKLSGVKGADYSDVVDAIFTELNQDNFNAVKTWKSI